MKIKYLLIYILITITIVVCGCSQTEDKRIKTLISENSTIEKEENFVTNKSKLEKKEKSLLVGNQDLTASPEVAKLKETAKKLYLQSYKYDSGNQYVQIVKKWVLQEYNEEVFECIKKNSLELILIDLNNDSKKDIIALPCSSFCGGGPGGCSLAFFISPQYKPANKYSATKLSENVLPMLPIYFLDSTNNGYKDLIINEKYLCKYNKISDSKFYQYKYICKD